MGYGANNGYCTEISTSKNKEGETELEAKDRQYRDWKENLVENGFFKKDGNLFEDRNGEVVFLHRDSATRSSWVAPELHLSSRWL